MITVEKLTKHFGKTTALDALCMTVPAGTVYGLIGPNGAGKTTAIRHIVGACRPESGSVLIDGQAVYENPSVKARLAYIPDDIFYYQAAGLRDMMKFYAGLYPRFDRGMYKKLQQAFGLDEKLPLRRFSKGMQKQAAFILAICQRPDVMVLDEPVDGLDPVMRRQVWSLIVQDVAEHETTVLISSHNLRELEDVCDHVGIMHKGKLRLERSLTELQGNVMRVQAVFREGTAEPQTLDVIHRSVSGSVSTLIVRGAQAEISHEMESVQPVFYDLLPLTLEEIFIYELGGVDYEIKNILL